MKETLILKDDKCLLLFVLSSSGRALRYIKPEAPLRILPPSVRQYLRRTSQNFPASRSPHVVSASDSTSFCRFKCRSLRIPPHFADSNACCCCFRLILPIQMPFAADSASFCRFKCLLLLLPPYIAHWVVFFCFFFRRPLYADRNEGPPESAVSL